MFPPRPEIQRNLAREALIDGECPPHVVGMDRVFEGADVLGCSGQSDETEHVADLDGGAQGEVVVGFVLLSAAGGGEEALLCKGGLVVV